MKKGLIITLVVIGLIVLIAFVSIKGIYNNMVDKEQDVIASWSQVENVYQRRMDLIPNLVEIVKGYAAHERETLTAVIEARSKMGGVTQLSPEALNDPQALERFSQAQASLGGTLQRLMMLQENYPNLKADQQFLKLQDQLEGTENRITNERRRFIKSVQSFNTYIKRFPQVILANNFGFSPKATFQATTGADVAPSIDMSN
ncbi:LemA family protein [bacterium]|nr:LemA family protein [bacterium]